MDSDCRQKGCDAAQSHPSASLLWLVEAVMLKVVEVVILPGMSTSLWGYQGKPGMSSLLVIPRVWARFIPATVIWAPESAMADVRAHMLVTLGRGKESS